MAKELTLNISERVEIAKILNSEKTGDLALLGHFIDDMKNIVITEAEWAAAGLTKTPSDEDLKNLTFAEKQVAQQSWNWNDTPETDKVITLDGDTVLTLQNAIKAKEEAKTITMADKALVTLKAKLAA